MFNTDACGLGSTHYGRTSDHVLNAKLVLPNGETLNTADEHSGAALRSTLTPLLQQHKAEIQKQSPDLPRGLTGYNLAKSVGKNCNLTYLLSGSEGTLGVVTELTLKLTPLPETKALLACFYPDFQSALEHGRELLALKPTAIETVDDNILTLAQDDEIYTHIEHLLPTNKTLGGLNLIEFVGAKAEVAQNIKRAQAAITQSKYPFSHVHATSAKDMTALWNLRKKGVGLLGNLPGKKRPVPFVEDTAVRPDQLPEFITEFRAVLEKHGLRYGMFGHVDAGCLHVRPALDMADAKDRALVPVITEAIHQLVQKYHGILWAEHSKGYRSEYVEAYFGNVLYGVLRDIKTLFDPHNQLNPGKIASSRTTNTPLVKVDAPTMRGKLDEHIDEAVKGLYEKAIFCNGNAACMNTQVDSVMCPSYKATMNRVHSPKGRAMMLRAWLQSPTPDITQATYDALNGCLGCKACASSCPVKVNIPDLKSEFLAAHHKKHRRPLRDWALYHLENALNVGRKFPQISNALMQCAVSRAVMKGIGLVDLPRFEKNHVGEVLVPRVKPEDDGRPVFIIPDIFTVSFGPHVLHATVTLLEKLGLNVTVLPYREHGKPKQVKGFLSQFKKMAKANNAYYATFAKQGTLIGLDPSMTLSFKDEYAKALGHAPDFTVALLQTFLARLSKASLSSLIPPPSNVILGLDPGIQSKLSSDVARHKTRGPIQKSYQLILHCTEESTVPHADTLWIEVFKKFGLALKVIHTGCCGMAGTYGHEIEHQATSKKLFDTHWKPHLDSKSEVLATGFSCRCQAKRMGTDLKHPIEVLAH
jgi:FAD/FMN-containing dehydrogenase/Fe-S oxidoreductase